MAKYPEITSFDERILAEFETAAEVISGIRTVRKEKNIPFKEEIPLSVLNNEQTATTFDVIIAKLGNLSELKYVSQKVEGAISFRVKSNEYFIPMQGNINVEEEIKKLEEELKYTRGFLASVEKKLSNGRFVSSAPEKVVEMERKKQADAEEKIKTIKQSLNFSSVPKTGNQLNIIGNGFDLSHDIKSKYSDFEKYVMAVDSQLAYYMSEYYSNADLWNDFEASLGKISSPNIYNSEKSEYMSSIDDFDEKNINMVSDCIFEKSNHINDNIHKTFKEWVNKIDITSASKIEKWDSILRKEDLYLSFNYTETLEKIYGIRNVLHIHGDVDEPIFGHNSIDLRLHNEDEGWFLPDEADDATKKLFNNTRKDVDSYIKKENVFFNSLSDIEEIYVIGHSLNDIDAPYFKEIISKVPNAKWTVFCYIQKEKQDFKNKLISWGVVSTNITLKETY